MLYLVMITRALLACEEGNYEKAQVILEDMKEQSSMFYFYYYAYMAIFKMLPPPPQKNTKYC